jgi:LysM repeat protein
MSVGQPKKDVDSKSQAAPVANSQPQNQANSDSQERYEGDTYTIKEGETLYRVFVNTGVSVDELKRLNNLNSNIIHVGQVLRLR